MNVDGRWDVFIAHASEDKAACVRPLAEALSGVGLRVWYDEFELKVGDSLRRRIDDGLARSKFGIVVVSPRFFEKNWPQRELDGLVQLEVAGRTTILPVWFEITRDQVLARSPTLADSYAARFELGLDAVVAELLRVIRSEAVTASHVPQETLGWERDPVLLVSAPWGNHIMSAYERITAGDRVSAVVLSLSEDDDLFFHRLQGSVGKTVGITWANRSALGQLERVEETRTERGSTWEVTIGSLRRDLSADVMDPGFGDIDADELAEMRARRLLLNEPLPHDPRVPEDDHNRAAFESSVRGITTPARIPASPFPYIFVRNRDAPRSLLKMSRLVGVMGLHLSGIVGTVRQLDLKLAAPGKLAVKFEGQRGKKYDNVEPPVIRVEGTCVLDAGE